MQGSSVILSELYQKLDFHNGNALQNTNHIFVYERFLIFLYEILKNIKVSAAHLLTHGVSKL